jgi:hypothetical protein
VPCTPVVNGAIVGARGTRADAYLQHRRSAPLPQIADRDVVGGVDERSALGEVRVGEAIRAARRHVEQLRVVGSEGRRAWCSPSANPSPDELGRADRALLTRRYGEGLRTARDGDDLIVGKPPEHALVDRAVMAGRRRPAHVVVRIAVLVGLARRADRSGAACERARVREREGVAELVCDDVNIERAVESDAARAEVADSRVRADAVGWCRDHDVVERRTRVAVLGRDRLSRCGPVGDFALNPRRRRRPARLSSSRGSLSAAAALRARRRDGAVPVGPPRLLPPPTLGFRE